MNFTVIVMNLGAICFESHGNGPAAYRSFEDTGAK